MDPAHGDPAGDVKSHWVSGGSTVETSPPPSTAPVPRRRSRRPLFLPASLGPPRSHAATARESEDTRAARRRELLYEADWTIRYAPPAVDESEGDNNNNNSASDDGPTPSTAAAPAAVVASGLRAASSGGGCVLPRLAMELKKEDSKSARVEVLRAMEATLRGKQAQTARCFRALHELQQNTTSGSMKALLQRVYLVLFRAAYQLPGASGSGGGAKHTPAVTSTSVAAVTAAASSAAPDDAAILAIDPEAMDELAGYEYFSLFTHTQQALEAVEAKRRQLETRLGMEQALEHELGRCLEQLDRDLHGIRTRHLENHELVESELLEVAQLEAEYATLLNQERELRAECEGLAAQVHKQRGHLEELQAQSAYLDFISRIPLKRHLEEKKAREQEEALAAVVAREEEENRRLERELAALDAQLQGLEAQHTRDVEHRERLGHELLEAEQDRDLLRLECERTRECHTPRPDWNAIIAANPELSEQYDWDSLDATTPQTLMLKRAEDAMRAEGGGGRSKDDPASTTKPGNRRASDLAENDKARGEGNGADEDEGDADDDDDDDEGHTQGLVKEVLQWIERLQKHCGVNLHLSRVWHGIEEARVELNILHHQLERALRRQRLGTSASTSSSPTRHKPKTEYIVALGIHEEIPLYLRHQGKLRHQRLKKGELETFVRQVWVEKRKRERRNAHLHLPLEDVVYEKLHRKYGFQPLIAEWGYNILLALNAYAWDAELELFLLCLTHALSDEVFVDQERMIDSCRGLLGRLCESYRVESFVAERRVLLKDALVTLRKFFPLKSTPQLQAVEKAIIRDMHKMKRGGNDSMLYLEDILPAAASYPRGFFVKTIRTQHFKEIQDYYTQLLGELDGRDEAKKGTLTLNDLYEAMIAVDPLIDRNGIWQAMLRGTGAKSRAQLRPHDVIEYKEVVKRMNQAGLLKFTLNYDVHAEIHVPRRSTLDFSGIGGGLRRGTSAMTPRQSIRSQRGLSGSSPPRTPLPNLAEPAAPEDECAQRY